MSDTRVFHCSGIAAALAGVLVCGIARYPTGGQKGTGNSSESSEIVALRSFPAEVLDLLVASGEPDERGLVGHNRSRWFHVALQRGAMLQLVIASVREDRDRAERAWRAVDAAFERQTQDGSFEVGSFDGKRPRRSEDLSGVAFWVGELGHAILVLQESALKTAFRDRIAGVLPRIERAARWLAEGREDLERYDRETANRLFFDAEAFGFSGLLLKDSKLRAIGTHFAAVGIERQLKDGAFVEKGGADSSYQAVSLARLQFFALYYPDERYDAAVARGIRWEISRVKENGEIDVSGNTRVGAGKELFLGREKTVSYIDAIVALRYFSVRTGDRQALAAADRVCRYVRSASHGQRQ